MQKIPCSPPRKQYKNYSNDICHGIIKADELFDDSDIDSKFCEQHYDIYTNKTDMHAHPLQFPTCHSISNSRPESEYILKL